MSKISFMDTGIAKISDWEKILRILPKEIMSNRACRIDNQTAVSYVRLKSMLTTPINTVAETCVYNQQVHMFSMMNFLDIKSVHELWSWSFCPLDLVAIKNKLPNEIKVIETFPEFINTSIINVTGLINRRGEMKDLTTLKSLVARGMLVRSYEEEWQNSWIPASLLTMIGRVYGETLSSDIATLYNLDFKDQTLVNIVFSAYFHNRCFKDNREGLAPTVRYCNYLGTASEITNVLDRIIELNGGNPDISFADACRIISELLPARLSKFTSKVVYQREMYLHTCHTTALMALEYPPYFVYILMLAMSGTKNGLALKIRKSRTLKKVVDDLVTPLTSSHIFNRR